MMTDTERPAPHRSRAGDPETSRAAGRSVSRATMTDVQKVVYFLIHREGPLSDEQLIALYREKQEAPGTRLPSATDSSIRTRRAELADAKLLVVAGQTKTASGRSANTWRAAGRRK